MAHSHSIFIVGAALGVVARLKKMIGSSANTFGARGAFVCFFFDLFILADTIGCLELRAVTFCC